LFSDVYGSAVGGENGEVVLAAHEDEASSSKKMRRRTRTNTTQILDIQNLQTNPVV
jgi:hypothetical protein